MTLDQKIKKVARYIPSLYKVYFGTRYIFILSHMRSRSSVLCHILGSNPEINGYRELHQSYSGLKSLLKMHRKIIKDTPDNHKETYLLDKMLHNNISISQRIFYTVSPKVIFLLRKPEGTIKSIVNMGYLTGIESHTDPKKAMNYYCSRLLELENYSKRIMGKYIFIESTEFVEESEKELANLSGWLDLTEPLSKYYNVFANTGKARFGDPSKNILSGELKKTSDYAEIEIPQEILKKGNHAYTRCREILSSGSIRLNSKTV